MNTTNTKTVEVIDLSLTQEDSQEEVGSFLQVLNNDPHPIIDLAELDHEDVLEALKSFPDWDKNTDSDSSLHNSHKPSVSEHYAAQGLLEICQPTQLTQGEFQLLQFLETIEEYNHKDLIQSFDAFQLKYMLFLLNCSPFFTGPLQPVEDLNVKPSASTPEDEHPSFKRPAPEERQQPNKKAKRSHKKMSELDDDLNLTWSFPDRFLIRNGQVFDISDDQFYPFPLSL
jgi:hypothetical protein